MGRGALLRHAEFALKSVNRWIARGPTLQGGALRLNRCSNSDSVWEEDPWDNPLGQLESMKIVSVARFWIAILISTISHEDR